MPQAPGTLERWNRRCHLGAFNRRRAHVARTGSPEAVARTAFVRT